MNYHEANNWKKYIFGKYNIHQVCEAIRDKEWQRCRKSMIGKSLTFKRFSLSLWYIKHYMTPKEEMAKVQITNYVYALKRGGLIKGEGGLWPQ